MERTANSSTFVLEPIDAPPSSPASSKMQSEDFAQFTSFVDACLRAIENTLDTTSQQVAGEAAHPENYIAVRGRYLDDAIAQRNPTIRQVVFLGAGLDTRVFRLESLHGCHVLELDQSAELFEHKRTVLKDLDPKLLVDRHDYVVADLNAFNWEEGLLSSGFNPDLPTFWALEGIMMYLTQASNLALLKTIDVLSAPGSEVWGDMAGRGLLVDDGLTLFKDVNDLYRKELGEQLFKHAEDDVFEGVFSELPWEMEVQGALVEPGTHFGREWMPTLTKTEKIPVTFNFVLAKKPLADLP
ncbi:putative CDP-alcohol phosphatidyltransferase [Phytophthora nicotianae]|uniref:CDP-alcohol phosphatidyltransferase n=1 Tax=Phytophthora nicotianae TaxID=4792 RepID=A0A0W8CH84_PHYNI|nr:putative CDP-alcohol phosphatidyltransferase [Phytophthora nicotianae]